MEFSIFSYSSNEFDKDIQFFPGSKYLDGTVEGALYACNTAYPAMWKMEIYTAIQEIGDLVASEVYKGQNFQSYLKRKFSEKGSISQTEFDLIERLVKLFLQSLTDNEIYDLWKKTETGSESIYFNKFEPEINSTKSELGNELIDLYITGL